MSSGNSTIYGLIAIHAAAPMSQFAQQILGSSGWMSCDGSAVPTISYPNLQAAISSFFGGQVSQSVVYNINVPDLRGYFPRGVNGDARKATGGPVDPDVATRFQLVSGGIGNTGNMVGSYQNDATGAPAVAFVTDNQGDHQHDAQHLTGSTHRSYKGATKRMSEVGTGNLCLGAGFHSHTLKGGDPQTVPVNMAIWYVIKTGTPNF
jgi:microcystin-dependent protein